jgi:hypothetical protein
MPLQTLNVVDVPDAIVIGIYKVAKKPDRLPARMRRLHPEALASYDKIMKASEGLVVSDMYRSPDGSLQANQAGRQALRPGYSSHGYGFAIDIDIRKVKKRNQLKTKVDLDAFMKGFGWLCHRFDAQLKTEAWHYDFDIGGRLSALIKKSDKSIQRARERLIQELYSDAWTLTNEQIQEALKLLGMYSGAIDGILGKLSKEAIAAFQRAWKLDETSTVDAGMRRTLWFVAANHQLPPVVA